MHGYRKAGKRTSEPGKKESREMGSHNTEGSLQNETLKIGDQVNERSPKMKGSRAKETPWNERRSKKGNPQKGKELG